MPIKALNAEVEPRYMQPMMNITKKLNTSAAIGTCCRESILPSQRLPYKALSRAKDHVRRDAVCCVALSAKKPAKTVKTIKTVAAASDLVP